MSDWDNYVKAVVTHVAGQIKYWELWSGADYANQYCGSVATMVTMAQHASAIIKSIDPTSTVLSPSVSGSGGPGWLSAFLAGGGASAVDVIAFRGFWSAYAEDILSVIASYQTVMAANNVGVKPLWDTAQSWTGAPSSATQVGFVAKTYLLQWSSGIPRVVWYAYDGATSSGGLWSSTNGVTPAGTAYNEIYRWMGGASLSLPCSEGAGRVWSCPLTRVGNYSAQAVWVSNATATMAVPAQYVEYRDLAGVEHPIVNGAVTIGDEPILLETGPLVPPATPTISPAAGSYLVGQKITIAESVAGATIHYTTDGTTPTASSPVYSTPIATSAAGTVKVQAMATEGSETSAVASASYTITAPPKVAQTPPPPPPLTASMFGMTVLNYSTLTPTVPFATTRTWDAYSNLDWAEVNSAAGKYNFYWVDQFVALNQARGASVIYTFGRTPQWASSKPTAPGPYGPGQCAPPTNLANWDAYVTAIVTHVAGKIKFWELWNEPDDPNFYCGDIPTMITMAQHARTIIKGIDPTATVLSPAVTGGPGPSWLTTFLAGGGAASVDVIAFHGYWSPKAEDVLPVIANYKTVMAANGAGSKPMWDTEASWAGFGNNGTPSSEQQVGFVAKSYLLQWSAGVSRFVWYAYDGGPIWGGMWTSTGGASPAATAYTQTYDWMVGASLTTPCALGSNRIYTCGLSRTGGYQAEAVWLTGTTTTSMAVSSIYTEYRDLGGAVHPVVNGSVTVGDEPILLETGPLPSQ
jgi:hypothetical protein